MKLPWGKIAGVAAEALWDLVTGKLERKAEPSVPRCDKWAGQWRCVSWRGHSGPCVPPSIRPGQLN